jgi:hypothetical protein
MTEAHPVEGEDAGFDTFKKRGTDEAKENYD